MNRGMLTLTAEELATALTLVPASEQHAMFRQRLEAAAATGSETSVECSEDDIEILLDLLPAPQEQPNSLVDQLRPKLQQTLMKMRTPKETTKPSFLSKLNPLHWFHKKPTSA